MSLFDSSASQRIGIVMVGAYHPVEDSYYAISPHLDLVREAPSADEAATSFREAMGRVIDTAAEDGQLSDLLSAHGFTAQSDGHAWVVWLPPHAPLYPECVAEFSAELRLPEVHYFDLTTAA